MSTKPICIETVNLSVSYCCVEALNSAVRFDSLRLRNDKIFEIIRYVLPGSEPLHICISIIAFVESCRRKLTHRVKVNLASIYFNNRFANIYGLADVSPVNKGFTCKHYWRSSNLIITNIWKPFEFVRFCECIKFFTGRTNVGQFTQNASKLEHIITFVVIKLDQFLHSF